MLYQLSYMYMYPCLPFLLFKNHILIARWQKSGKNYLYFNTSNGCLPLRQLPPFLPIDKVHAPAKVKSWIRHCIVAPTLSVICTLFYMYIRLKHGIGADQDFFMLYHWYRKNIHDMNKFHKLTRLTVTYLFLLKISRY